MVTELIANNSYKLLSKNSLQTILMCYYQRIHCKQYLPTIIKEIIPNNTYKLTRENSLQIIVTNFITNNTSKLLSDNLFQTILTNYYQRTHCKQCLETII